MPLSYLCQMSAGCLMIVAMGTSSAMAGHYDRLEDAADRYRDAVSDFEDHAEDVRTVDRQTLRWIDRLEDAASDLRSASRRPEHSQRLLARFAEVESLQFQVERAVFGRRCPLIEAHLRPCWEGVLLQFDRLAAEVSRYQSTCYRTDPRFDSRHRSLRPADHYSHRRGGNPYGYYQRSQPRTPTQPGFSRSFGSPFPSASPFSNPSIGSSRTPFDSMPPGPPGRQFGAALIGSLLQRALD